MDRELQEEVVLDLPCLLAQCLRKGFWILLISLVFGLFIPSLKFYQALKSQKAEISVEDGEEALEKKAQEREQSLEYATRERKRLEALLSIERESLLHSELMKIDSASYGERDISIYLPIEEGEGLNEQESAARLAAVTQAYIKVLQSSSFYSEIGKTLPEKIGEKDLAELIYVYGNERSGIVSVYMVGSTEKLAKDLGDAILSYLEVQKEVLNQNLPAYRLEILSDNVYTAKNSGALNQESSQDKEMQAFPLLERQQKKIEQLENRSNQLTDWKKKEKEAKEGGETVLGTQGLSKKSLLKYGVLGILLGGFLSVAAVCLPFLFAKQLPGEEDLEISQGLMVLGSKKRYKRQGLFPKWSEKLCGDSQRCDTEEALLELSKANLSLLSKEKNIQEEILFVVSKADMGEKILQYMQEGENGISGTYTEDILQSTEGIHALANHRYLVLAYSAKTDFLLFLKAKKKCEALGKEVLGVILY